MGGKVWYKKNIMTPASEPKQQLGGVLERSGRGLGGSWMEELWALGWVPWGSGMQRREMETVDPRVQTGWEGTPRRDRPAPPTPDSDRQMPGVTHMYTPFLAIWTNSEQKTGRQTWPRVTLVTNSYPSGI